IATSAISSRSMPPLAIRSGAWRTRKLPASSRAWTVIVYWPSGNRLPPKTRPPAEPSQTNETSPASRRVGARSAARSPSALLAGLAGRGRAQGPLAASAAHERRHVGGATQPVADRDRLGKPSAAWPCDRPGRVEPLDRAAGVAADQRERGRGHEEAATAQRH